MTKMNSVKKFPVSIVVPTRNAGTTIIHTLKSLVRQTYPIKEILVVDNASIDNTLMMLQEYRKKTRIPVFLVKNATNKGVGHSYNLGVKKAKSKYVVFIHSDSSLPSATELTKLMEPFYNDTSVIATYSKILMPEKNWARYNFWMRCLFARVVGKESPGLNGKFDCVEKKTFLDIGGFDTYHFAGDKGIGGEDADLHERLKRVGNVVLSGGKVVHLHYLGSSYALSNYVINRKLLARSYGRYLRLHGIQTVQGATLLVKPFLAVLPFIPGFFIQGLLILFVYSLFNSQKMYVTASSWKDKKIGLLPLIDIFLVYYEIFWMAESFLKADIKR